MFDLNMEFSYRDSDEQFIKKMVATIHSVLKEGRVQIGAKTNSGFGEIKLIEGTDQIYVFDFRNKNDVMNWLARQFSKQAAVPVVSLETPFDMQNNRFSIEATLQPKNSLMIRSYSEDPEMPDATHIKSLDCFVLTGTSLKGAIRARAERIIKTLGKPESIIANLFGKVEDKNHSRNCDKGMRKKEKSKKGKIRIKEVILPKFIDELQTRIKIDRFTGGTIETALFDSMPLFVDFNADFNKKVVKVIMHVNDCSPPEAGLLLLVLKDLWTGDLAVGGEKNVGRGVFEGLSATITWNNEKIVAEKDLIKLSEDEKKKLQGYVNALNLEH